MNFYYFLATKSKKNTKINKEIKKKLSAKTVGNFIKKKANLNKKRKKN